MSHDDDLLKEFLVESYENLDRLDDEFVALEEDPGCRETLSSIFRTIHTIKGTSSFFEFARLEAVTHAGEHLLSALREGQVAVDDEVTTALLHLVDAVRAMLAHIEQSGAESGEEYAELVQTLTRLQEGHPEQDHGHAPALQATSRESGPPQPGSLASSNIRVQVAQLDKLMNLAGELVLARNQVLQGAATSQDPAAVATAQRLNLVTTELQERIMKIRMQPVGMLWSKLPRVVRDLSRQLGKVVRLGMQGQETELDKTLLEAIKDPLTHIVRNSIDHGIEAPEARKAAGKDQEGTLLLEAFHESGHVHIEITDDGKGIDADALKAKALASGLLSPEEAGAMTERMAHSLIFHPGLSTAKTVTNVSGRGVGMDVVKTNIEKIGGTVEVSSTLGRGTTVRIKIPLTLAIIPALIVTTAGDRYAIPQVSLVELVRLDGAAARAGIEYLGDSPVYRLRGELLPLLFLDQQLRVAEPPAKDGQKTCQNIVIVRAADQQFGLVVDEVNDTQEIVVKPLDQQTKSIPVYAGTTILGDGQVALILDVLGLATRAEVLNEDVHQRLLESTSEPEAKDGERGTYVLLQAGEGRRMAVSLSDVDRLEEFAPNDLERSGMTEVVQYRGEIMPLVRVARALGLPDSSQQEDEPVRVIVARQAGRSVGLIVDTITDIVEADELVRRPSQVPGIKDALVIDGKVTDRLDLAVLVSCGGIGDDVSSSANDARKNGGEGKEASGVSQYCTFYLGDLYFGVDVVQVQEVLRHQPMTRVPLTTNVVRGLINLRGQTVTALDMRSLLGIEEASTSTSDEPNEMNVVLRTRGGIVSILVDRIGEVLEVEDALLATVPKTVDDRVRELLTGVYKLPDALLLPLDIERLVEITAAPCAA